MGDTESIELDERGVVVRRIDARGDETLLVHGPAPGGRS
jgi:hypothetical protein